MIKTTKKIVRVAFFGDADTKSNEEYYQIAKKTAELLTQNGYIVIDGGGPGIMLAATEGAGGKAEIVIIDPNKVPGNYEGTDDKNLSMAAKIYKTNNIEDRTNKLIEIADAFVIFKGGTGTLAEMALVWEKAKFEYGHHEPMIFVGKQWREVVESIEKNMNFETMEKRVVTVVDTPEEVIKALIEAGN